MTRRTTKTIRAYNPHPPTKPMKRTRNRKGQFTSRRRSKPRRARRARRRNPAPRRAPARRRARRRAVGARRRAPVRRRRRTYARRSNPTRRRRTYRRRSNPARGRLTVKNVTREVQHLAVAGAAGGAVSYGLEWAIGQLKAQAIKKGWLAGLAGNGTPAEQNARAARIAEYAGDGLQLIAAAMLGVWAKGRVRNPAVRAGLAYVPAGAAVQRIIESAVAMFRTPTNNGAAAMVQQDPTLVGYGQRGNLADGYQYLTTAGRYGVAAPNLADSHYWQPAPIAGNVEGYMYQGDTLVAGPYADEAAQTDW